MASVQSVQITADETTALDPHASRLRLQTTIRLRWFAVVGQLIAVMLVYAGFDFPTPIGWCLLLIAASVWLNIFLRLWYPARTRLQAPLATGLLAYDIAQLAALLYLTGGVENPFTVLLVAPVTVSAATLPASYTVVLGGVALVASALLVKFHQPLPWHPIAGLELPVLYKIGLWCGLASCTLFVGMYGWRLSEERRQMSAALAATELVLAREQKLHALDGLAAAAAHELGTPLGTIVLVAKELERDTDPNSPLAEDVALLKGQAMRCREILQKLTLRPTASDPLHASLTITQLIEEAVAPHRAYGMTIDVDSGPYVGGDPARADSAGAEPVGERKPGVIFGIGNLIENAVEFARAAVTIGARWNEREVSITIMDDGTGFAPDVMESLGEPYVTTRRATGPKSVDAQPTGLGLGFFIAKTLLERSGATVELSNRTAPATGAVVTITWKREAFEANGHSWPAHPRAARAMVAAMARG